MPESLREYVVSAVPPSHPSLKANFYGLLRRNSEKFAVSIGRELAEGPTQFIPYDMKREYPEPMELWPLVYEEGEKNSLSG